MENITKQSFKEKIFNFEAAREWKFAGTRPCIVDFYADWCGPCKMLAPALAELAEKYAGRLDIYKIDTDKEPELSALFGVQSIPTLLFIPLAGKPQLARGARPREDLERAIVEVLKIK